jgi:uncharacterized membrane protein YeaQ/YmgE (transglycosylase-associated protein family)
VLGALLIGVVAGCVGRLVLPRGGGGLGSIIPMLLGVGGSLFGFLLFTEVLGIGDNQLFDLAGLIGAASGAMILLALYRLGLTDDERPLAP